MAAPPPAPPTLGPGPGLPLFESFIGEIAHLEGTCQPVGTTFAFRASGVATGPYPGTFTETGSVTIGPPDVAGLFLSAHVVAFESSFRIEATFDGSPVEITGTKRLAFVGGTADCADALAEGSSSRIAILSATYEARIRTARGVFFDRGGADVRLSEFLNPAVPPGRQSSFSELFISELGATAAKPGRGCGDENHDHLRASECNE